MNRFSLWLCSIVGTLAVALIAACGDGGGAGGGTPASPCIAGGPPAILLDMPAAGASTLTGDVCNYADPNARVVVFALTNTWYVQPFASSPYTLPNAGRWSTSTHPWSRVVALLVDASRYTPPATSTAHPALASGVLAWVEYPSSGPIALDFAGRRWGVKQTAAPFDPGPNLWSNDPTVVGVAGDGLHLRIAQLAGRWQSAEVHLLEPLGYGTYTVNVATDLGSVDAQVVASPLFLYAMPGEEFDVEYSGAGGLIPAPDTGQFVVQPYTRAGNLLRFRQPTTPQFTVQIEWRADRIAFRSWDGWDTAPTPATTIAEWTYTGVDIPPADAARVHINLWLLNGTASSGFAGAEMVIRSFDFRP